MLILDFKIFLKNCVILGMSGRARKSTAKHPKLFRLWPWRRPLAKPPRVRLTPRGIKWGGAKCCILKRGRS
ncbi:hypothetical protein BN341_12110 [Helicobacter heilmannii ASB1.4]|nr:hypothetical protein BN341_12110 [Helicobacter heilmannii ASB1.4]